MRPSSFVTEVFWRRDNWPGDQLRPVVMVFPEWTEAEWEEGELAVIDMINLIDSFTAVIWFETRTQWVCAWRLARLIAARGYLTAEDLRTAFIRQINLPADLFGSADDV